MYCCIPKGTSLWWKKKGTVINHHWCSASSLLGPAFCHHKFNYFPASSSFPLYSIFTWKLIFFSSPPSPSYGPCTPKLLLFLSGLCFFHPLSQQSSPVALLPYFRSSGEQSLPFFPSSSLCPQLPWPSLHPKYILPLRSFSVQQKERQVYGKSVRNVQGLCFSLGTAWREEVAPWSLLE